MPAYSCKVAGDIGGELRLDRYVAEQLKLLSRSQIKARALEARLNGKKVRISRPVKPGDLLELSWTSPEPVYLIPEDLPLDILYEDERVVVVNKAQGMVVHPGAGNRTGTLANALLFRRRGGAGEAPAGFRPGIVHRLDKDTSGVIIAAYDDQALAFLADQFKARTARKIYAALVRGRPKAGEGWIETRITRDRRDRQRFTVSEERGKIALTYYQVKKSWGKCSLLLLRPKTGRTHQLRVHLRYLGCPILGDPLYGFGEEGGLMLHAKSLSLVLPGETEKRIFRTPLPPRFALPPGL
ncbi:MAG: RluA family pseudouridine synthase [Spirochaetaceae bacterium]|nr:RluA family pseudouridine synthase [Spirochaetaceae bacterium]